MAPRPNIPDVMSIQFLLLAQFGGRAMIPIDEVRQHFFPHLQLVQFMRKLGAGDISLPVCRMDSSNKSTPMVLVSHLAIYIKRIADSAEHEAAAIAGWKPVKDSV